MTDRVGGFQLEGDDCHLQDPVAVACCQDLDGCFDRGLRIHSGSEQTSTGRETATPHRCRPPTSLVSLVCYAGGVMCSGVNSFSPFEGRVISSAGMHNFIKKI